MLEKSFIAETFAGTVNVEIFKPDLDVPAQGWTLSHAGSSDSRDAVIRFWLAAPMDQIQALWSGGFGEITRQLVNQLSPSFEFTPQQVNLRNALNQRIGSLGLTQPLAHQLLVALFLLSPPGLLKIGNPEQQLPPWLVEAFKSLYDNNQQTMMVLGGSESVQQQPPLDSLPRPDFGAFPTSLAELVGNRVQLNRLLGLSNLYYIDPEDQEITQELVEMRRALAQLIQAAPSSDLERIWSTEFGDRYWALVRSGIQNVGLGQADQVIKEAAIHQLSPSGGGFESPTALNAFLIVMMYLMPGGMRVEAPEQKLPSWLLESYRQVFEQAQPTII